MSDNVIFNGFHGDQPDELARPRMTDDEAKAIFDAAIDESDSADQRALLKLCREYLFNPDFKVWLMDTCFALTRAVAK